MALLRKFILVLCLLVISLLASISVFGHDGDHETYPDWNARGGAAGECGRMGYPYGYKIDPPDAGTYNVPGFGDITITTSDGVYFDWSSTFGVDAVISKGGDAANVYRYDEAFGDTGLHSPNNSSGGPAGLSHITICFDYDLQVSKTASTSYTNTYTWDITKGPDGEYWMFIGDDAVTHDYDVFVDQTITPSNWVVSGTITITNPDPTNAATIDTVTDTAPGATGAATINCPSTSVPAGGQIVCTYSVPTDGSNGTNTAVVTTTGPVDGGSGTAPVDFTSATINVVGPTSVTVSDVFNGGAPHALGGASGDTTLPDAHDFVCPTDPDDYLDGVYNFSVQNVATIDQTGDSDDAWVTVHCYAPLISKDAAGAYDELHTWDIEKYVDPESQNAFVGETVSYEWTVILTEDVENVNFSVTGQIVVSNPNPQSSMTVSLSDVLDDGTGATISSCAGGTLVDDQLTIGPSGSATCDYSAAPDDQSAANNTATATLNGIEFDATDSIEWSVTVIDGSVTVDDDQNPLFPLPVSDGATWKYTEDYQCSEDAGDYIEDGTYSFPDDNTATVSDDGGVLDSSDASTVVNCYAPVISKDAAGTYDERHEWDIDKTVDPESQDAFAGETVSYEWTVVLTEEVINENYSVTGQITVSNPHPDADMTVTLSDILNTGTVADITECVGGTLDDIQLTIPAGGTATCDYEANPDDAAAQLNVATAVLNGINFTAAAGVEWTANVIHGDVTVDDNQKPDGFPVDVSDGATWDYSEDYTCPTDAGAYDENGTYTFSEDNTATVSDGDVLLDEDDATTAVNCYAPVVSKTADESYTRTWTWDIVKSSTTTSLTLSTGQQMLVNYNVTVTASYVDNGWQVTGTITVHNPHPSEDMVLTSLTDIAGGISAVVTCDSLVVPAGGDLVCTYDTGPQDSPDVNPFGDTNTATAVFAGANWIGTHPIAFGAPTTIVDECVTITDDRYGALGTRCATTEPYSATFNYSLWVGPYSVCGNYTFVNVASLVTNDTATTDSDNHTVNVNVPCAGCTLTQGYWKTHSDRGPAPYDNGWLAIGPLQEDTLFFSSGRTWYVVFWTPPAGNAYYNLAHQYMAAKLNILNGAGTTPAVVTAIADAETLFNAQGANDTTLSASERRTALRVAAILDQYNNGIIGPGHCSE